MSYIKLIISLLISFNALATNLNQASIEYVSIESQDGYARLGKIYKNLGLSYFIFWEGPNLKTFNDVVTNELGETKNPINTYNLISLKYKLSEDFYFDVQTGTQWFQTREPRFNFDRVRVGVSGPLWKKGEWELNGAFNSDLPYTGYTARERTVLLSPGVFGTLNYRPRESRFSYVMLMQPRVWFYQDNNAVEKEWLAANRTAGEKFQAITLLTPTVNYAINDKLGLRSGLTIDYRKQVQHDWNKWVRWMTPFTIGPTYKFSKMFETYLFIQSFPLDGGFKRYNSSIGMWLSGTLF
jgi:hypothetical protein